MTGIEKSGMSDINVFVPISKIDAERRMVYGYASTGALDSQGEIVDLDATFAAVEDFSKWATLKEMHRPETAAGVIPVIEKHEGIGLYVGAEVVDDQAWRKVEKKVYKGFSIGGKCHTKKGNHITKYELREISLVDRPANPDALFVVAKRFDANPSNTEAEGGKVMENAEIPPPVKEAELGKKAEEIPSAADIAKKEADAAAEAEIQKRTAEFEDMKKQLDAAKTENATLKKRETELTSELQKKAEMKDEIMKMVSALTPDLKKAIDAQNIKQKSAEEMEKERISKMSIGQLSVEMMKTAGKPE